MIGCFYEQIKGKEGQTLSRGLRKSCIVWLLSQFKTWEWSSGKVQCWDKRC